jgi:hypothetical protein
LPSAIRSSESWFDGLEYVTQERIVYLSLSTIGLDDFDLLQGDNLVRRNRVFAPVPEWLTKISGSLLPLRFVLHISRCKPDGMLLKHLLYASSIHDQRRGKKGIKSGIDLKKRDVRPVPRREKNSAMRAIASGCVNRVVPLHVRPAMDATYTEV